MRKEVEAHNASLEGVGQSALVDWKDVWEKVKEGMKRGDAEADE